VQLQVIAISQSASQSFISIRQKPMKTDWIDRREQKH